MVRVLATPRFATLGHPAELSELDADRPQHGGVPQVVHDDGRARLLQGDCARLLEAMSTPGVNLIVTSPPYSLGVDYGQAGYTDDQPYAEYLAWVRAWAAVLLEVSAPG